jgi:hypothetical protein
MHWKKCRSEHQLIYAIPRANRRIFLAYTLIWHQSGEVLSYAHCFVIIPFDKGPYMALYKAVIEPAIKAAGLDPYRVDRDHGTQVLTKAIEDGIRTSAICIAEITTKMRMSGMNSDLRALRASS